jgi:hypothetical protein
MNKLPSTFPNLNGISLEINSGWLGTDFNNALQDHGSAIASIALARRSRA